MLNSRKEMRKKLQSSCLGVLQDCLNDVGFNEEEKILFKERYIQERSVPVICLKLLYCGTNKYNRIHNRILDKCISHFNRISSI